MPCHVEDSEIGPDESLLNDALIVTLQTAQWAVPSSSRLAPRYSGSIGSTGDWFYRNPNQWSRRGFTTDRHGPELGIHMDG